MCCICNLCCRFIQIHLPLCTLRKFMNDHVGIVIQVNIIVIVIIFIYPWDRKTECIIDGRFKS
jgi:hypothetical protein